MLGRLTLQAFEQDMIEHAAGVGMLLGFLFVVGYLTYRKRWKWLWKEWLTTLDPKKIGMMYMIVAFVMLFKGLVDALMMRAQQVFSVGDSYGYLSASHFQQLFTAHGTTMIFFVGMGVVFGFDESGCAFANRRARCGLSFFKFSGILAFCQRSYLSQLITGHR